MIVLKNGKVLTMSDSKNEFEFVGDVLIDNGKIVKVDKNIDVDGAEVIDVTGKTVMPGMIDAHCHIGMWESGMGFEGADGNEATNPVTPEMRAIDGINPFDQYFEEAYRAGVTCAVTGPGSANVVGGQFVAIKTYGDDVESMIVKEPIAMKAALGENPKRVYSSQKKSPTTRMANAAILRKTLLDARTYMEKKEAAGNDKSKMPDTDLGKEALIPVLKREIPLKIHCHRADDILTAIRISKEFDIRFTLDHCTEGYMIAEQIKRETENARLDGIIIGPLFSERSKIELRNKTFESARILDEHGIEFAMMTDHPVTPLEFLPLCASVTVRDGLSEEKALKSVTINPAKILKLDDRIGSIEPGKDADIAVFAGDPLDSRTRCVLTMIDGKIIHNEIG